jgi:hypothetical protein
VTVCSLAEFYIENVHPIRWSENAFARLVLPLGYKDIIRAFVQEQLSRDDEFDDIIYGKGGTHSLRQFLDEKQIANGAKSQVWASSCC